MYVLLPSLRIVGVTDEYEGGILKCELPQSQQKPAQNNSVEARTVISDTCFIGTPITEGAF